MAILPPPIMELEARLGVPTGSLAAEDLERAEAALLDATTLVLAEVSPTRATAWSTNAPPVVALIALKAARREFENPQGISQEAQGDHSISLSESSGVYLTAREIAQIRRVANGRTGANFVGSIRTPSSYESPREPLL